MQVNGRTGLRQAGRSAPSEPGSTERAPPRFPRLAASANTPSPTVTERAPACLHLSPLPGTQCYWARADPALPGALGSPFTLGFAAPWLGIPTLSATGAGPRALRLSGPERTQFREACLLHVVPRSLAPFCRQHQLTGWSWLVRSLRLVRTTSELRPELDFRALPSIPQALRALPSEPPGRGMQYLFIFFFSPS